MSQNIILKFEGNNHEDHLVLCVSWGRIPFHELLELDVYQHCKNNFSNYDLTSSKDHHSDFRMLH